MSRMGLDSDDAAFAPGNTTTYAGDPIRELTFSRDRMRERAAKHRDIAKEFAEWAARQELSARLADDVAAAYDAALEDLHRIRDLDHS